MRRMLLIAALAWAITSCGRGSGSALTFGVPQLDHVIVVVMENKSYAAAMTGPYTASLAAQGVTLSRSYAVTHPSQPNYLVLWSGSTQGVRADNCPAPGAPFSADNLGHACEAAGRSWRAYAEDLPAAGSTVCSANNGLYVRRHAPWTQFSNLSHANERPLSDLDRDLAAGLPSLAFVIPNMCNDTHGCPVSQGDAWLASHVPAMLAAVGPRGIVVLTWDEDDTSAANHILTIVLGTPVKRGYASSRGVTHYTLVRTLCAALGLPAVGDSRHQVPITDIWNAPPSAAGILRP